MRLSGTHLYKRVCPSVRPSVCRSVRNACAKNKFFGCFWSRWDPTLKQMIHQHVLSLLIRLFVHLSLHTYVTWLIHAEKQPGRIVAWSGLFSSPSLNPLLNFIDAWLKINIEFASHAKWIMIFIKKVNWKIFLCVSHNWESIHYAWIKFHMPVLI